MGLVTIEFRDLLSLARAALPKERPRSRVGLWWPCKTSDPGSKRVLWAGRALQKAWSGSKPRVRPAGVDATKGQHVAQMASHPGLDQVFSALSDKQLLLLPFRLRREVAASALVLCGVGLGEWSCQGEGTDLWATRVERWWSRSTRPS
jgi:hypothetical protein